MKTTKFRKFFQVPLLITIVGASIGAAYSGGPWSEVDSCKLVNLDNTIHALYGRVALEESNDIAIDLPEIGENGAVVPVSVRTSLPNTKSISLLVERNPNPFAAKFNVYNKSFNSIATRIKVNQCSDVIALVETDNKIYTARRHIKITIAGCGG